MATVVDVEADLVGVSHIVAGLLEVGPVRFASLGRRNLKIAPASVRVVHDDMRLVFDFHDAPEAIDRKTYEWSDLYFKVNPPDHPGIIPYGYHFPVQTSRAVLRRLVGSARVTRRYRRNKGTRGLNWRRLRRYRSRLSVEGYESTSMDRPIPVFFNPGYWPGEEAIDLQRANIIRGVRALGGVAGFAPSQAAKAAYPDLLLPLSHEGYVEHLKRAEIVVTTNGLGGCHSWRTGEAFAAGAVVVQQHPVFPAPQSPAVLFDTPEECVAVCEKLLSADLAPELARHQAYYRDHVAPGAKARWALGKVKAAPGA